MKFDIITIWHCETNWQQALVVKDRLHQHSVFPYEFYLHDNSINNIGFSAACNIEASKGDGDIISFINPDAWIEGDFMTPVLEVFEDENIWVTGGNFNKNPAEIADWGLQDWVCGAAAFIRREKWVQLGGFDEQFVWSYEETDFYRRTELAGGVIKSLSPEELPILHSSPTDAQQSAEDSLYKARWMGEGGSRFWAKWSK